MKKWLASGLVGITALCAAFTISGCATVGSSGGGDKASGSQSASQSSSSSSSSSSQGGGSSGEITVWNIDTVYAKAQSLGYSGSLEEFMETIKGDPGQTGATGVGVSQAYIANGVLYIQLDNGSEPINCGTVKGQDGAAGVSPKVQINPTTKMWEVSYDNGASWQNLGVKAEGTDGQAGSVGATGVGIKTVYIENGHLYVELTDNVTKIDCGSIETGKNDLTGTDIRAYYFDIAGDVLTDQVSNVTTILYMGEEVQVADGATYTVCSDPECNLVFRSKIVELAEGDNTFYIKVVNGAESKIYTVNVYRAQTFNVSFDTDGGSAVSGFKIDENETFEAPTTTKLGYTFTGWVTAGGEAYDFSAPVTADVSLTATWELDTYALSYDLAGGTLAVANPDSYNVHTDTITLNEPTRVGYVFDG
ncbi:MAG: InlB B-repeat-containing protein, partial [Clostridia bacterium]|nr:InlB B-repeat-containing protein [Clostridia bacterium]